MSEGNNLFNSTTHKPRIMNFKQYSQVIDFSKVIAAVKDMVQKNENDIEALAEKIKTTHQPEYAADYAKQLFVKQKVNVIYRLVLAHHSETLEEFVSYTNSTMRDAIRTRMDVRSTGRSKNVDGLIFTEAATGLYTAAKINFVSREEFKFAQVFDLVRI